MADYVTLAETKAALPDTSWTTAYDAILASAITRASRDFDLFTQRGDDEFAASVDETRYFDGSGNAELWIGELAAAPTSVAVAEGGDVDSSAGTGGTYTIWAASDFLLWPYNAATRGRPFLRLDVDIFNGSKAHWFTYPKCVKIVGKFGYSTVVPDPVKKATIILAIRHFKRGQQAYHDTGAIVELGQLTYTQKLDPDVALAVEHYARYMPEFV